MRAGQVRVDPHDDLQHVGMIHAHVVADRVHVRQVQVGVRRSFGGGHVRQDLVHRMLHDR
jgi:hypothetical protein